MAGNGQEGEIFNEQEREAFRQVAISLERTLPAGNKTNRPVHDFAHIQDGLKKLGKQRFEGDNDSHRLNLALEVHLPSDGSRTAVSEIILSIKRQAIGLSIRQLFGKLWTGGSSKGKGSVSNNLDKDTYLKLTPNGYQISDTPEALSRRQARLMAYTPEAAEPIGAITTEFLKHLRTAIGSARN